MTKYELIQRAHRRLRCEKVKVTMPVLQQCAEAFLGELFATLATEVDHVELRTFGVFDVVPVPARQNRMPRGDVVDLPKRGRVRLRLSRQYQDALNKRMAA